MRKTASSRSALLIVFAASASVLLIRIDQPFNRAWENQSAVFALSARNILRYPPQVTKFGLILGPGGLREPDVRRHRYLNHPPLIAVATAASFWVFGDHEASARLVQILFALGCGGWIYLIARRRFGESVAVSAAAFFLLSPLLLWHGRVVEHSFPPLFFFLGVIFHYGEWSISGRRLHFLFMCLLQAMGCGFDWMAFLALPSMVAYEAFHRRFRGSLTAAAVLIPAGGAGLFLLHVGWMDGSAAVDEFVCKTFLGETPMSHRWSATLDAGRVAVQYLPYYLGIVPCMAASAILATSWIRRRPLPEGRFLLALALPGVAWGLLLPTHAATHSWFIAYPLLPVIALLAGLALARLIGGGMAAKSLAAVIVAGFLFQSAWIVLRRHSNETWYEAEYGVIRAARSTLDAGVRFGTSLRKLDWELVCYYTDARIDGGVTSSQQLEKLIAAEHPPPCFFLTTTARRAGGSVFAVSGGISDQKGAELGFLAEDDSLLDYLNRRYPRQEADGFMIYRLCDPSHLHGRTR